MWIRIHAAANGVLPLQNEDLAEIDRLLRPAYRAATRAGQQLDNIVK